MVYIIYVDFACYNGDMEVGDWITLAAVVVALGIGVASILHTQSIQEKERRERLLNEIIEWATDIVKASYRRRPANFREIQTTLWQYIVDIQEDLLRQQVTGYYITNVSPIFGQVMSESVSELMKAVQDYIDVLFKPRKEVEKTLVSGRTTIPKEEADKLDKRMDDYLANALKKSQVLENSARKVIREATKLK